MGRLVSVVLYNDSSMSIKERALLWSTLEVFCLGPCKSRGKQIRLMYSENCIWGPESLMALETQAECN